VNPVNKRALSGRAAASSARSAPVLSLRSVATWCTARRVSTECSLRVGRGPVLRDDYLFEPGLVYFGTATLGPCSRQVIEATTEAWRTLETNPTAMGYPGAAAGSPAAVAEETRGRAARLLGCAVEELVITRSTTDGMK